MADVSTEVDRQEASSRVVLAYWGHRCLVQPVKLLLVYLGIPFEDRRYVPGPAPLYKKGLWRAEKSRLESLGVPFPNLPYFVDVDGSTLTQTRTIMRHLCRTHKPALLGGNRFDETREDLLAEQLNDYMIELFNVTYCAPVEFSSRLDLYKRETVPKRLASLEVFLEQRGSNTFTLVDFLLAEWLEQVEALVGAAVFDETSTPLLRVARSFIDEIPELRAYVTSEAYLSRPFHNVYSNFTFWENGVPSDEPPIHGSRPPSVPQPECSASEGFVYSVFYPPVDTE
jgi:glutathione S-transferase